MLYDILVWSSLAITPVSFVLDLLTFCRSLRVRHCRRESYRSFKGFGIEWTSYDRDDRQS
jgi:hypothetical protein